MRTRFRTVARTGYNPYVLPRDHRGPPSQCRCDRFDAHPDAPRRHSDNATSGNASRKGDRAVDGRTHGIAGADRQV